MTTVLIQNRISSPWQEGWECRSLSGKMRAGNRKGISGREAADVRARR